MNTGYSHKVIRWHLAVEGFEPPEQSCWSALYLSWLNCDWLRVFSVVSVLTIFLFVVTNFRILLFDICRPDSFVQLVKLLTTIVQGCCIEDVWVPWPRGTRWDKDALECYSRHKTGDCELCDSCFRYLYTFEINSWYPGSPICTPSLSHVSFHPQPFLHCWLCC